MNTAFSEEDLAFQQEVQAFIKQKYTPELAARAANPKTFKDAQIEWQKILFEQGWIAPNWPAEYGGTGWTPTQSYIFDNERAMAGISDVVPFGLKMVGPVIYTFGNDEQKERFLPAILSSDDWWCQGYSEPGAGSDLAALQTKAVLDGDDYIVNGAKIWTTYAQHADWIFCLVRTDSSGKRQSGISFLLIDMKTPGIEVRPIHTIDNYHSLNEVIFKDVRVPVANRIGEQDAGWTYAKALLAHERVSIAEVANSKRNLAEVKKLAQQEVNGGQTLYSDTAFRSRLAETEIELMALEYTELRVLASVSRGETPGPESSLLKIKGTEIQQAIQELRMQIAGYYCGVLGQDDIGHEFGSAARQAYMYGRAASIYGGSNEVQRNVIARAVLRV
ncbi:MAG: pimeloyl-CoA dehydrogenase large subunit [Gammaproteobacteria bacterium]|nr:pimeloyl-CoA dehydrogenase large subunit [Gammaproteobacteria bacterium]